VRALAVLSHESGFGQWLARAAGIENARLGERLGGGNSNITRLVHAPAGTFVLRHPPTATISDNAARGIGRERRVLEALAGLVCAPRVIAWCEDPQILGAPFLIVSHVDGVPITERLPEAYHNAAAPVDTIGEELIDALATLHSIAPARVGLADFGRPENFLERQIGRLLDLRQSHSVRELPLLAEIGNWLISRVPPSLRPSIVHLDFHLDNTLFAPTVPRLLAIIDWEMATLADPRVDLGLFLMFWKRDEAKELGFRFVQRVSNRPDVVDRQALAERWAGRTGLPIDDLAYFQVFAFWRLAAIVEGAFVLHRRGEVDGPYERGLERDVPALLAEAAELLP
jgi:aminoglycoside phosphotransferase (APT) family kinase protein